MSAVNQAVARTFATQRDDVLRGATVSACGRYRYALTRAWGPNSLTLLVVMLNPSVADAERDDPTVTRLVKRAKDGGYDRLVVCNLFAYRATDPRDLVHHRANGGDARGPQNLNTLLHYAGVCNDAVVAWGNHPLVRVHERSTLDLLYESKLSVECLGLTKDGYPRHPLHVGYAEPFRLYTGRFAR